MKIRMKIYVSGTHDGEDWPRVGEIAVVDDEVGADMCAHGLADPVADKDGDVETRRGPGRPPGSRNKPKTDEE